MPTVTPQVAQPTPGPARAWARSQFDCAMPECGARPDPSVAVARWPELRGPAGGGDGPSAPPGIARGLDSPAGPGHLSSPSATLADCPGPKSRKAPPHGVCRTSDDFNSPRCRPCGDACGRWQQVRGPIRSRACGLAWHPPFVLAHGTVPIRGPPIRALARARHTHQSSIHRPPIRGPRRIRAGYPTGRGR